MFNLFKKSRYFFARAIRKARGSAILNCEIHSTSAIEAGSQLVNTKMDRHSFCGYDCVLLNCNIGSFCSIADQVYAGGSHHPIHFISGSPVFLSHRDSVKAKFSRHEYSNQLVTHIGDDVWIGHGAKIKAGVNIGVGAAIGMGSIVTKDVPPYAIVGGNPARVIRYRFSEEVVIGLLKSKWWEREDHELISLGEMVSDPKAFLVKENLL